MENPAISDLGMRISMLPLKEEMAQTLATSKAHSPTGSLTSQSHDQPAGSKKYSYQVHNSPSGK